MAISPGGAGQRRLRGQDAGGGIGVHPGTAGVEPAQGGAPPQALRRRVAQNYLGGLPVLHRQSGPVGVEPLGGQDGKGRPLLPGQVKQI